GIAPREMPVAIGRSVPFMSLLYGRVYNADPATYDKILTVASKAMGMKAQELRSLVGVLERSGLIDSVAMHSQIRTTARTQAFARQLSSASSLNRNTSGNVA